MGGSSKDPFTLNLFTREATSRRKRVFLIRLGENRSLTDPDQIVQKVRE